jgi:NAD(P)-dependent dehydrogenase (short-subunit alcohol dehydrogenase family)
MSKGLDLSGKVALVTGGSRGIGEAIALAFSEAGADVAIVGRDEAALEGVLRRLRAKDRRAEAFAVDMSCVGEIEQMIDRVKSTLGPVDILVNAAGIAIPEPAVSVSEETWSKVIDTNLRGQFFCASRIGRGMIERRTGVIINISSEEGLVAVPGHVAYCISKAAIIHMTKVLAVEWGQFGVRVNCIAPAAVRTRMNEDYWLKDEGAYRWVVSRIALGRVSDVEEMTGAALYLASDASSYVTGATIVVDGGISAGLPKRT